MDGDSPIRYCIILIVFIFGGAYFAGAEISLASVSRIRMMSNADNNDKRAKKVLYILDHFDKALTTMLIGNNIMHIGCATISTLLATKLWGVGAVPYATVVTTIVLFLIAEMIPKCFAKSCNENFASSIASSLIFLMKLLTPVSFIFTSLSKFVSKPFEGVGAEQPTVTEDELYDIIDTIVEEGAIDEETGELVHSALEFSDTTVKDIVTPWEKVLKVYTNEETVDILKLIKGNTYSRLPLIDERENVIGIINVRKFLKEYMRSNGKVVLEDIIEKPRFIDSNFPVDDLLPEMSKQKTHIAIVKDEDKNLLGIVTMEDILEELVGDIYDEEDMEGCETHVG